MSNDHVKDLRLAALRQSALLDSPPDERFDRITRIARSALGAPVALISLVDEDRQFFKSCIGLPEPWASLRQTPLSHSFCQYVVRDDVTLRINDARNHELVRDNLAVRDLGVEAYLGVPIRAPGGYPVGSLCVIDSKPRNWTAESEALLSDLRNIVEDQIALSSAERHWRSILNAVPLVIWSTLPDGYHDFYNDRWYEVTGVPHGSTDGEGWNGMFHSEDQERAWERWRQSLNTGGDYEIEYRLRQKDGQYRWMLGRALPIRDEQGAIVRWFGTCVDIHDMKAAEEERELINQELAHRIRNIFAVIGSLISMSARQEPAAAAFADELRGRTSALAHAYSRVLPASDLGAAQPAGQQSLHALIRSILAPYPGKAGSGATIAGTDLQIGLRGATSIALIIHELATNAVKYGALSQVGGSVEITTSVEDDTLVLIWREHGGPAIAMEPKKGGFGSVVMTRAAASQLAGSVERVWEPSGLVVELRAALGRLD
ncbi:MAG: PAS domain-containing protein [Hyphomicrobiaceae bacterium]